MNRLFASTVLTFSLCFAAYIPVNAQSLPSEVIEAYKAYLAAEETGKKSAVEVAAKAAYKAAEKHLGDHKTTGDLAQNYAETISGRSPDKAKDKIKIYLRSAELATLHTGEDAVDFQLQRLIKATEAYHLTSSNEEGRDALTKARSALDANNLSGSTYDGEVLTLESKRMLYDNRKGDALRTIDKAIAVLENPSDKFPSAYLTIARLHKALILKRDNDILNAALTYQDVMQSTKGKLPNTHPAVSNAFRNWISLRSDLVKADRLKEAEKAGLCECWPFEGYKDKIVALKRAIPSYPADFLEENYSGHTYVIFDVTDDGKTENIEIVISTDERLNRFSIESVEKWEFPKKTADENPLARKGLANKIAYNIVDTNGNLFPEPRSF